MSRPVVPALVLLVAVLCGCSGERPTLGSDDEAASVSTAPAAEVLHPPGAIVADSAGGMGLVLPGQMPASARQLRVERPLDDVTAIVEESLGAEQIAVAVASVDDVTLITPSVDVSPQRAASAIEALAEELGDAASVVAYRSTVLDVTVAAGSPFEVDLHAATAALDEVAPDCVVWVSTAVGANYTFECVGVELDASELNSVRTTMAEMAGTELGEVVARS